MYTDWDCAVIVMVSFLSFYPLIFLTVLLSVWGFRGPPYPCVPSYIFSVPFFFFEFPLSTSRSMLCHFLSSNAMFLTQIEFAREPMSA